MIAGEEIVAEKRRNQAEKVKAAKKKLELLKQGKDIRLRAMQTLRPGTAILKS